MLRFRRCDCGSSLRLPRGWNRPSPTPPPLCSRIYLDLLTPTARHSRAAQHAFVCTPAVEPTYFQRYDARFELENCDAATKPSFNHSDRVGLRDLRRHGAAVRAGTNSARVAATCRNPRGRPARPLQAGADHSAGRSGRSELRSLPQAACRHRQAQGSRGSPSSSSRRAFSGRARKATGPPRTSPASTISAPRSGSAPSGMSRLGDADGRHAADPTAMPDPDRKGIVCAPAEPAFNGKELEEIAKATQTQPDEWGFAVKDGIEVRSDRRRMRRLWRSSGCISSACCPRSRLRARRRLQRPGQKRAAACDRGAGDENRDAVGQDRLRSGRRARAARQRSALLRQGRERRLEDRRLCRRRAQPLI